MTVHNGAPYLRTSIDSILRQTFRDFCFLIVDDASTDASREIIRSYEDKRLQLVCLEKNVGQTAALNIGLRHVSTPWIARMDADDYSAPTRLQEQMQWLNTDSSLGCLGTFAWWFRDDPNVMDETIVRPEVHEDIRRGLLKGTAMIHGSIVIRKSALLEVGAYNERYYYSADFELYDRLLDRYRAANIPRLLLGIRRHNSQGSFSKTAAEETIDILSRMLSSGKYSREEVSTVRARLTYSYLFRARCLETSGQYFEMVLDLLAALRLCPKTFVKIFATSVIPKRFTRLLKAKP